MCAMRPSPNGFWLPVYIAKMITIFNHRVTSRPRLAFEGLEPCDGKLSCPVLRGLGAGNSPRLPGLLAIDKFYISRCESCTLVRLKHLSSNFDFSSTLDHSSPRKDT